jgi:hypothetical protein
MLVLPGLAAAPAAKVKLTALAERLSVSDSANVAFSAMVCAPEFNACAEAIVVAKASPSATAVMRESFRVFIFPLVVVITQKI